MDTITLLKKLITFRTSADNPDQIVKICDYIEKLLTKKKIHVSRHYLDGKPVLYACTVRTKKPTLLLVPHLDVVPGTDDQFIPKEKGAWLYGRGAGDCKNNVVVVLRTLLALAGTGRCVGALLSTDEEIGGATTRFMVNKGYTGKINLLLDGSRSIVYRQKGVLNLQVSVKGKSAHGSEVWEGDNANEKLMDVYGRIKKLFPATTPRNRWKRTVNLGIMQGGDVINKVADAASMQLNIRLTEKDDAKAITKKIRAVKRVDGVAVLGSMSWFYTDPKSSDVRQFKAVMEKSLKVKLPLTSMHGATDAHNFAGVKGTVIISGVGADKNIHGKGEAVHKPSVLSFEKALLEYVKTVV